MNNTTAVPDVIEREVTVKAPIERVFNAITDPKQIVAWFPDGIEGEIKPGESPVLDFGTYGKSQIYIVAVEPYGYFAYRWRPGGSHVSQEVTGDVLALPNTLVEFHLQEISDGTIVKLKESGFASLPPATAEQDHKDNVGGWEYMFDRLEALFKQD